LEACPVFFANFSPALIPPDIAGRGPLLRGALFALFLSLIVGVYAYASQVTVTYQGTVTSMNDISGYFGSITTGMNGKAFTMVFTMDDTKGSQYLGTWPTCSNGLQATTTTGNPVPTGSLTITTGNRPYVFGALAANSLTAFTSSSNATSPKTTLFNKTNPVFTGGAAGLSGSQTTSVEIDLNSTNTCRNWESSWMYTLTTGDSSSSTISADFANTFQGANIDDFSATYSISNVTVSGTSPPPTQTISSPENWSCMTCDPNQATAGTHITWNGNGYTRCDNGLCYPWETRDGRALAGGGEPNTNAMVGEPVNAAVGNVYLSETDFVGGPATYLSFTRFYNSHDLGQSGLGVGWRSNYHRALTITSSTVVSVTAVGGRQDTFTLTGGNWVPQSNVTSVLVSTTSPSGYQLTLPDDSVENYNSSGVLTSIVTRERPCNISQLHQQQPDHRHRPIQLCAHFYL
jgi:hypothetical protein